MKKKFSYKNIRSIIDRKKYGLEMSINSKVLKIISLSVTTFFVGISVTGIVLATTNKTQKLTGVGGLETSGVPEFVDDLDTRLIESAEDNYVSDEDDPYLLTYNEGEDDNSITYQTYRVQSGDMISVIADKYDVTQDTIISVNNIKQSRLIQPGQYLKIPSMPGIIYTVKKDGETLTSIAEEYDIKAEKCALVNNLSLEDTLDSGTSLFLPEAELDWTTRQEINGDLFKKPLHCRYWLSSPYGWRDSPFDPSRRTFHSGIDMAANMGNNVYPAMDGVVIEAGYNTVYGNYVIIKHHSGYITLYGHLSEITCRKGNFVYTNTIIGKVGSTGMSTGPHLHFTVYKNGKTVNPLSLMN